MGSGDQPQKRGRPRILSVDDVRRIKKEIANRPPFVKRGWLNRKLIELALRYGVCVHTIKRSRRRE